MKQQVFFEEEPVFTDRDVKSVTFQGKLDLPIHRWYRLTPSFSPNLAWDLADYFKLGADDLVLDPFSGVGTVPLCMKYRGIPACSIELNPYLFFDFIEDAAAVGDLETAAIGGTWGRATSALIAGVEPANALVRSLLAPYIGNINGSGPLMAHYVTKYFNDIYAHASEIAKICREHARLAYVIGNSKFYEHHLPSDEILAGIFTHFGFTLERIDRMRKRQSKKGLYEAVVFMRR